ncbi:unnamed protein product [Peronospora farinosa]|uniref:Uncharacterized protein n=1 Tax=Peronospora farinosa TaxID=134698 RepID=A0ABN8BUH0_9STRA|nr:unnamed protein product [Peronospora farinosa]
MQTWIGGIESMRTSNGEYQNTSFIEQRIYAAIIVARQLFGTLKERLVAGIEREGMIECFDGLAVPPVNVTASASKTMDPASLHGGCPPMKDMERVGHEKRF